MMKDLYQPYQLSDSTKIRAREYWTVEYIGLNGCSWFSVGGGRVFEHEAHAFHTAERLKQDAYDGSADKVRVVRVNISSTENTETTVRTFIEV
jgi:hypothetical protein